MPTHTIIDAFQTASYGMAVSITKTNEYEAFIEMRPFMKFRTAPAFYKLDITVKNALSQKGAFLLEILCRSGTILVRTVILTICLHPLNNDSPPNGSQTKFRIASLKSRCAMSLRRSRINVILLSSDLPIAMDYEHHKEAIVYWDHITVLTKFSSVLSKALRKLRRSLTSGII